MPSSRWRQTGPSTPEHAMRSDRRVEHLRNRCTTDRYTPYETNGRASNLEPMVVDTSVYWRGRTDSYRPSPQQPNPQQRDTTICSACKKPGHIKKYYPRRNREFDPTPPRHSRNTDVMSIDSRLLKRERSPEPTAQPEHKRQRTKADDASSPVETPNTTEPTERQQPINEIVTQSFADPFSNLHGAVLASMALSQKERIPIEYSSTYAPSATPSKEATAIKDFFDVMKSRKLEPKHINGHLPETWTAEETLNVNYNLNVVSAHPRARMHRVKYSKKEFNLGNPQKKNAACKVGEVILCAVPLPMLGNKMGIDDLDRSISIKGSISHKDRICIIVEKDGDDIQIVFATGCGDSGRPADFRKHNYANLIVDNESEEGRDRELPNIYWRSQYPRREKTLYLNHGRPVWIPIENSNISVKGFLREESYRQLAELMKLHPTSSLVKKADEHDARKARCS